MIYCIQDSVTFDIKIGFTDAAGGARSRLKQLQTGNPSKLVLVFLLPGNKASESLLHQKFAKYRVSGEWFKPAPDVLLWMLYSAAFVEAMQDWREPREEYGVAAKHLHDAFYQGIGLPIFSALSRPPMPPSVIAPSIDECSHCHGSICNYCCGDCDDDFDDDWEPQCDGCKEAESQCICPDPDCERCEQCPCECPDAHVTLWRDWHDDPFHSDPW